MAVTHSIPESCALAIETPGARVLHTGDWKLDPAPLIGPPIDSRPFERLAPVDLVVADSTNADVEGHSRSESEAGAALEAVIRECRGRVAVSCFASNLARIQSLGQIAARCGRRVALLGRSMERMVAIARQLGYLEDFPPQVPTYDLGYLPPEEILLIATGSQGEPRSALSRLAQGRHPLLDLEAGDHVIFSARAIPGNERPIERLKNGFRRLDVHIHDEHSDPALHASGHPARAELRQLYGWLKPRLRPVHGELTHQEAHRELAETLGIAVPKPGRQRRSTGTGERHAQPAPTLPPAADAALAAHPRRPARRSQYPPRRAASSLSIALTLLPTETGWTRIGRLLWDSESALDLDEEALADWLDQRIDAIPAESLLQLRQQLFAPLNEWLKAHLAKLPELHLQLMPADPQPEHEVRTASG
ncbi:ribonuclease J [Salinicola tamaricis]|uniref:ribonuclease J n=1 Tax=Salinicola tamaricis TaxID=1771309 RepID=UPI001F5E3481|nr:ribonuclease J [Salinicola tamaricis]